MKIAKFVLVLPLLLLGAYLATSGWIASTALEKTTEPGKATNPKGYDYKGINFRDEESLNQFLREQAWSRWCPWIFDLPREILPLVASAAFGFFGGTIRALYLVSRPRQDPSFTALLTAPPFGAAIGCLLFMLSLL